MKISVATMLGDPSTFEVDDEPDAEGWRRVTYADEIVGSFRVDKDGTAEVVPAIEGELNRTLILRQVHAYLRGPVVVEEPAAPTAVSPLEARLAAAEAKLAELLAKNDE